MSVNNGNLVREILYGDPQGAWCCVGSVVASAGSAKLIRGYGLERETS